MMLRIRDRDCAAGFLDRKLPRLARRAVWKRLYPGRPGPFPAVYEPTASQAWDEARDRFAALGLAA